MMIHSEETKQAGRLVAEAIILELKTSPDHWVSMEGAVYTALDADGNGISSTSDGAVCWCIQGLIYKHLPPTSSQSAVLCYFEDLFQIEGALYEWNDAPGRTVDDVIGLFESLPKREQAAGVLR